MPLAGEKVKAYNAIEQDTVSTAEATASSTYTDLPLGAGPSVTVHLEAGQSCLIVAEAMMFIDTAGANGAIFTVEVAGPGSSDLAAADANGAESGVVNEWTPGSRHTLFTAAEVGDHVCTMKYRRINVNTANFKERRITAIPQPPPS